MSDVCEPISPSLADTSSPYLTPHHFPLTLNSTRYSPDYSAHAAALPNTPELSQTLIELGALSTLAKVLDIDLDKAV